MISILDITQIPDLLTNILTFLNFEDTLNFNMATTNILTKEQLYWKSLEYNKIFKSMDFLIKSSFDYEYDEEISILYDYINNNTQLCVAGGFPTLLFNNKNLSLYPSSDIDIFIMEKDDTANETIKLIKYINKYYKAVFLKINKSVSVFDVKINGYNRTIQLISTKYRCVNEILNSFDMGYNKCALYGGETFVTYDAMYAKNIMKTHTNNPKHDRIYKACVKGFSVHNCEDYKIDEKNHLISALKREEIDINNVIKQIKPANNFLSGYSHFVNLETIKNDSGCKVVDLIVVENNEKKNKSVMLYYLKPSDYNVKFTHFMPKYGSTINIMVRGNISKLVACNGISIKIQNKNQNGVDKLINVLNDIHYVTESKYVYSFISNTITKDDDEKWRLSNYHVRSAKPGPMSLINPCCNMGKSLYLFCVTNNIDRKVLDTVYACELEYLLSIDMVLYFDGHLMVKYFLTGVEVLCDGEEIRDEIIYPFI